MDYIKVRIRKGSTLSKAITAELETNTEGEGHYDLNLIMHALSRGFAINTGNDILILDEGTWDDYNWD